MATYRVSFKKAMWKFPRLMTFLLMPVYAQRQGANAQISFADRASIRARQEARRWIETYFEITDEPIETIGWQLGDPPAWIKNKLLNHGK